MRGSIKVISLIITFVIFIVLNIVWFVINPSGESLSTSNPAYYIVLFMILVAIFAIAFYFYSKSRQKTKIKL
ncbi:MAG: hypothetical protein ACTSR8_17340 [Promethearchaeota archaeon]